MARPPFESALDLVVLGFALAIGAGILAHGTGFLARSSAEASRGSVVFLGRANWLQNDVYAAYVKGFRRIGFAVRHVELPCGSDLTCWRQLSETNPNWLTEFVEAFDASRPVTVVGRSRAGYVALVLAARYPNVQAVALSPVVDFAYLAEFIGASSYPPSLVRSAARLAEARVFIAVGHDDRRVGTALTQDLVAEVYKARPDAAVTLVVTESPGHKLADLSDAVSRWAVNR